MKYDSDLIEAMYVLQKNNSALAERMWNRLVKQEKSHENIGDVHISFGKIIYANVVQSLRSYNVSYNTYNKVQAIKELRNRTGWGLKEAKDAIEFMVDRGIIQ